LSVLHRLVKLFGLLW